MKIAFFAKVLPFFHAICMTLPLQIQLFECYVQILAVSCSL